MVSRPNDVRNAFSRESLSNFFTIARFGPDTLIVFAILSGMAIGLYYWGMWYVSVAVVSTLIILFCIESVETIVLSRAEYRQIVGARCLVIQGATSDSRGIVRLFSPDGNLDPELWSTEISQSPLSAGEMAIVTGMNSVILEISRL